MKVTRNAVLFRSQLECVSPIIYRFLHVYVQCHVNVSSVLFSIKCRCVELDCHYELKKVLTLKLPVRAIERTRIRMVTL